MTEKTKRKPGRLRSVKLDELSLVDHPANQHARVTLFKRAEEHSMHAEKTEQPISFATFRDAVDHLARHTATRTEAMSKAARAHPDLLAAYRREGREVLDKAALAARRGHREDPPEKQKFDALVKCVRERDGVSRTEAMRRARLAHPAEFDAYRSA